MENQDNTISGILGQDLLNPYDLNSSITFDWSNIAPLTTAQLSSLNNISIQSTNTGINSAPYTIQPLVTPGTSIYDNTGIWTTQHPSIKVQGDAEVEGDLKLGGKSIKDSLEKIEEKLAILHPNTELEEKWEKLRELRRQYIACEKDIIEKEKIWETLKK